jgi:sucrose-6F-phosphate phosphohydrolase
MERVNLLACDLDGTLLGDDDALQTFADWFKDARRNFRLAYASGRFVSSVMESIAATALPEPDAIIGGVGAEIYDMRLDRSLTAWPPVEFGWDPQVIRNYARGRRELTLQPEEFLGNWKISFFARGVSEEFLRQMTQDLAALGQQADVVYSSRRDLDVLPAGVNKGSAVAHLAHRWNIDPDRVIVAGDSGNDAAMMRAGFRGIVVGNADDQLRALAAPRVYVASAPHAAGVLEGVRRWSRDDGAEATHAFAAPGRRADRGTPE